MIHFDSRKKEYIMSTLLLIDDDDEVLSINCKYLSGEGYSVYTASNPTDALKLICQISPDCIILDIMMPQADGYQVCKKIRTFSDVPIIFLTSRTDAMDELTGMLKGGDDYITKPYQAPILLARIVAVLKRTKGNILQEPESLSCRGVILRLSACSLEYRGQKAELTKNELKILHCLYRHEGSFVPRMDLIEYLWENQVFIDDNTLSVNVTRLREKLKQMGIEDFIETKRGMGYRV